MTDKVLVLLAQEECGEFSLSLPPHSWEHFLPTLMDSEPLDLVLMVLSLILSLLNPMYHWLSKISWIWIVISMKVPLLIWQRELMEVRARYPCPSFSLSNYDESEVCHIIYNLSLPLSRVTPLSISHSFALKVLLVTLWDGLHWVNLRIRFKASLGMPSSPV